MVTKYEFAFTKLKEYLSNSLITNSSVVYSNFFQLATVDSSNNPQVRTVVFRGFYNDAIKISCNINSNKIKEIAHNDTVQICWYFPISREQFRITCKSEVVTSKSIGENNLLERNNLWNSLTETSKEEFIINSDMKSSSNPTELFVMIILKPIDAEYFCAKAPFERFKF